MSDFSENPTEEEVIAFVSKNYPSKLVGIKRQLAYNDAKYPKRPGDPSGNISAPKYDSWAEYIELTPDREIRKWCSRKASRANKPRLMSGEPETKISTDDVYDVLMNANGRCHFCDSLAVEYKPSGPWEPVGRRIGSLGHRQSRLNGGPNTWINLVWSCLMCNTWDMGTVRKRGATDYGAIQVSEPTWKYCDACGEYKPVGDEFDGECDECLANDTGEYEDEIDTEEGFLEYMRIMR